MTDHIYFHTGYHTGVAETYCDMDECLFKIPNPQFVDPEDDLSEFHNVYEVASIFLQGACHIFSLALHQEFGYDEFEIRKGTSCHCFCRATYQGRPIYIDIRGATTSWEEFLAGTFADFHHYDEIVPQDIEETAKLDDPDDLYAADGLAFAKHLIHEHPEYYNISNLQMSEYTKKEAGV